MATTKLTLIGEVYDCVRPLFDQTLRAEGVDLAVTPSPSPEAMRRQLRTWGFDICEMAFGAYLIAKAQGADVTAIPVFPRRAFFHTNFLCQARARIAGPRALAGKRIGVAEYVQSATLWARGALEHDYGLDARNVQWFVERFGSGSTGETLGFKPPRENSVQQTPGGQSLVAMLASGDLDMALVGGNREARENKNLQPLFADVIAEGRRFYAAHGYVPANHTYMIRGSLAREQPALVASLYRAFAAAKAHAQQSLPPGKTPGLLFGNESLAATCASFQGDPFAYGIAPNRAMLETVVRMCGEQELIRDLPALEDMFAPGCE
jgi:4,5-dihydroxyphthalate decarboxylase